MFPTFPTLLVPLPNADKVPAALAAADGEGGGQAGELHHKIPQLARQAVRAVVAGVRVISKISGRMTGFEAKKNTSFSDKISFVFSWSEHGAFLMANLWHWSNLSGGLKLHLASISLPFYLFRYLSIYLFITLSLYNFPIL